MISHLCSQAPSQDLCTTWCWLPHRTNIVFCLCWLPHRTNPGFLLNGWQSLVCFTRANSIVLAAVIPSAASIRCIFHHDCIMVRAWSRMHLLLFVSSDSYVRFVRFVRAIHQIRPCNLSDSSVRFNRFVRAIYCNTYIHIQCIQQFYPLRLPALLHSWWILVWMNGRLASNIGLCSLLDRQVQ